MVVELEPLSLPLSHYNPHMRCSPQVLKKLGHISEDGNRVLLKGRAMCEIDTADELLVTELMFDNTFAALSVPQLVSLLSCLISVEKSQDQVWFRRSRLAAHGAVENRRFDKHAAKKHTPRLMLVDVRRCT